MPQEPDVATIAALIGEPSRAVMLSALLGGEALPASELAYRAQVTPQTASSHLQKLLEGDLIKVSTVGRHRYYALKNREVAHLLESLSLVAPMSESRTPRTTNISQQLCTARTCYDHLAGKLGVAVTNALLQQAYIGSEDEHYILTDKGIKWLESWQIDVDSLQNKRRKFAFQCLDWSERRFHIAGTLGAAIADLFFDKGWVKRLADTRALAITPLGETILQQDFGINIGAP